MVCIQQQRSSHQIKQPGPPTHPAVLSKCLCAGAAGWAGTDMAGKKKNNIKTKRKYSAQINLQGQLPVQLH